MNDTLLDSDKTENDSERRTFKTRVPSDLMIVTGVLHAIVGLVAIIYYFTILYQDLGVLRVSEEGYALRFLMIRAAYNSLIFFFGFVLLIGGIGLIRHQRIGWVCSLAASTFGILIPGFILVISWFIPGLIWARSGLFAFLFILFFGASFIFLISKTIRKFYQPTVNTYVNAGVILFILSLVFVALPFLTAF